MLLIQCYFASGVKKEKEVGGEAKEETWKTLDQLELCVPPNAFVCASGPSMARAFRFLRGKVYGRIEKSQVCDPYRLAQILSVPPTNYVNFSTLHNFSKSCIYHGLMGMDQGGK